MKITPGFEAALSDEMSVRAMDENFPKGFLSALEDNQTKSIHLPEIEKGNTESYSPQNTIVLESIILAFKRPSLLIRDARFEKATSDIWGNVLESHRTKIDEAIPSVGRIEFKNHAKLDWGGSGFLVSDDIVVTNRHVAKEFAKREGDGFTWKQNARGKLVKGRIDFREEYQEPEEEEHTFSDILHIETSSGPDIAFMKLANTPENLTPLQLSTNISEDDMVSVIGYPWRDSRVSASIEAIMKRIFNDIYDVKRLAPGKVTGLGSTHVFTDCTTLGGNSGSAVIDIESGSVVGLHVGGAVDHNVALKADVIDDRLQKMG